MNDSFFPSETRVLPPLGLDADRFRALPGHAIVMHPGPMNRGMEIAPEVADSAGPRSWNRCATVVSVRMAVLYLLLGGNG
jgi:aspartate carbamoyltransferase catalytic subunit